MLWRLRRLRASTLRCLDQPRPVFRHVITASPRGPAPPTPTLPAPQNLSTKSTGQLSLVTYALNWAGASARIFTSIQEGAGAAMVRGAAISE